MKNKPRISSSTEATYEADKKTRKFWNVSPVTKVIPNKKKNPKIKHKEKMNDDYMQAAKAVLIFIYKKRIVF